MPPACTNPSAKWTRNLGTASAISLNGVFAVDPDPRRLGARLTLARHRNLWRYRVGDYRIVAEINDTAARILIVRISHRRDVCSRLPS